MGTNNIVLQIVNTPDEAPNYNTDGRGVRAGQIDKAVIVRQGTVGGYPTVDLQFTDDQGNRYVAMITARLLRSVCIAAGVVKPGEIK